MTLNEYLTDHKIKNSVFAESLGLKHPENVRRWRKGVCIPTKKMMDKIITATGGAVQPQSFYNHNT